MQAIAIYYLSNLIFLLGQMNNLNLQQIVHTNFQVISFNLIPMQGT